MVFLLIAMAPVKAVIITTKKTSRRHKKRSSMKIHYFQRYHSKENVDTSNTMLMLSHLYSHDSDAFFSLLNNHILGEPETPEIVFDLQVSGKKSVPDAVISQKSFKIVVETKLYNQFNSEQLMRHLDQFGNEEIKVLLTLDPKPMNADFHQKLDESICKFNSTHSGMPIRHINLTFKQLLEAIESIVDDRDREIVALFDDFSNYCFEENLIPDGEKWMRAVAVWETIEDNIELNLYYDPKSQGCSDHGFIGLYSNKSVRAIGRLQKVVIVSFEGENPTYDIESNELVSDDEKLRINEAYIRAEKLGYDLTKEPQRFFLVEQFYETDYAKSSKYPIRKSKRFNLVDILDQLEMPPTEQIAQQLRTLTWE